MSAEMLLWALIALQVVDIATTMIALRKGAVETNPLMRWLFDRFGTDKALILFKGIAVAIIANLHLPAFVLAGLCVLYIVVVINNLKVLKGMRDAGLR